MISIVVNYPTPNLKAVKIGISVVPDVGTVFSADLGGVIVPGEKSLIGIEGVTVPSLILILLKVGLDF